MAPSKFGLCRNGFECARWRRTGEFQADARATAARTVPAHKLSEQEHQRVLDVCHEARFADLPPAQIVPRLADEGTYLGSESSLYRILRAAQEQQHRGRAKAQQVTEPQRHVAHGPNEVWSWDVTYLSSQVRGMSFYLYAVIAPFSRKLVAWEVHAREGGDEAAALKERACWRERRRHNKPLVLHTDNGAAQKAHTLKSKLETLGITPSHSRPGVSDDNAHIEAWLRTCKYAPSYPPSGFEDIELARQWVLKFVSWYNGENLHSGLSFVTPERRHSGIADAVLKTTARGLCAGAVAPSIALETAATRVAGGR